MFVATSDPQFDLSLRFLSLVVSGAIIASLLWYLVLLLQPLAHFSGGVEEMGPPAWAAMPEPSTAIAAAPPATKETNRASARFTVFRCEVDGSVTYADRPCERGGMRVLRLPSR